jgi:hypothetical protein
MTWEPDVENELIYDYEIGLSSTKDSLVPDLVPYRSTKHHQHFRLNNPDLTEGGFNDFSNEFWNCSESARFIFVFVL